MYFRIQEAFLFLCSMPILKKYTTTNWEALIWETKEPLDFFLQKLSISTSFLLSLNKKFRNKTALKEWLASRYTLELLTGQSYQDFAKTSQGKLYLPNSPFQISVSHSAGWVMVAQSTQSIGIDIQIKNSKLKKIAPKYIAAPRLKILEQNSNFDDYLHFYWGMKEALFKAYGLGKIDFRQHLQITPFDLENSQTTALLQKKFLEKSYQLFYQKIQDYYISIAFENL